MRFQIKIKRPDGSEQTRGAKAYPFERTTKLLRNEPVGTKATIYEGGAISRIGTLVKTK